MPMRHAKRQPNTDLASLPSASGISGSQYLPTAASTATSLISDNTDSGTSTTDVPDFVPGSSIVLTTTLSSSSTPSSSGSPAASASKSVISLSTVIGVCIGVFVGAGLLICLSVWFYRRSIRSPPRTRQQPPLARSHGINPASPWTKFDNGKDKWDGQNEKGEHSNAALPPRTHRATSGGKSLSSDGHFGSEHDVTHRSPPFSNYHPKLPQQEPLEPPRHIGFDNQSMTTMEGSTSGTFLSLGTVHIESGKMSPTFNVAKMTPTAIASTLHRWESAEVIDPDADAQEVEVHHDPFSDKSTPTTYSPTETFGDRRSYTNPFFNAHPGVHSRRPSLTKKSTSSVYSDPFDKDEEFMTMPKPKFISHTASGSSSSGGSTGNGKAMQNLIAALELPKEVIEERLRVASMDPSEASRYSTALDSPGGFTIPVHYTEGQGYVAQ